MTSEDARFESDFDKIMRWYRDESGRYQLSESLQGRLTRWKFAREYILTQRPLTDTQVVNYLMRDHAVSEPQAWRDVRDCKRFFASMEKTNKEFDRIMLVAQIKDLRTKAELKGQYKVAATCDATLQKMGVGEESTEEGAGTKTIELVIGFNPKLVGAKEIPNLQAVVAKYIGEEAARRELMIADENEL